MAELTTAELTAVADQLAIRNLLARIAQLSDTGEIDDYMACYTDDAVWDMPANPAVGLEASRRSGADVIREGVVERRAAGVQGPGTNTLHVLTTTSVDVEDDDATGHTYFLFYANTAGPIELRTMGQYHDRFRRTSDGWKLAHRRIVMG